MGDGLSGSVENLDQVHPRSFVKECELVVVLPRLRFRGLAFCRCLLVDGRHRVAQLTDISQAFGAEPGCVFPVKTFAEGVVWRRDVPMAINVRGLNRTLRPIRLPLRHLHPHHRREHEGKQGLQHEASETGMRP